MVQFCQAMSAAPDPAELAPSRDPAAYGRRPLFTTGVLVWLLLCLACLAIGAAAGRFGFPAEPAAKPEASLPDAAPRSAALAAAPSASAPLTAPPSSAGATTSTGADTALVDRVARVEGAASRQTQAAGETLAAASL